MNYRDLQNISNLSQEILIEGANEEHNVLNRWPYTSPYLQEDYNQEAYVPWDFGPKQKAKEKHTELAARKEAGGSAPGTATRANRIASTAREMRTTLDQDSAMTMTNPKKQGLQPSTPRHTAAAVRGAGGGTTARTKFDVKPLKPASKGPKGGGSSVQGVGSPSGTGRYQVGGGQGYGISGIKLADSYDLYDIILSHLLDEGYAETLEQAQVIMVNMSEDWRESICEGYKKFPYKRVENKIDRMYDDPDTDIMFGKDAKRRNEMMRVSSHMKGETHPLIRSESPKKSKAKEKENRARGVR